LRSHSPSAEEIANLLVIVNRDLKDADGGISSDWRFGIAYNAALKLCSILLYASSYQAERNLQHYRTIQALPLILGDRYKSDADYLEMCRKNRNKAEDDSVGVVSEQDAEELIEFVNTLLDDVLHWLKTHHPELLEH
tara:strand:+ start:170 stop:580 length:411 start_codon:yes stop_codon:yes gene_type:complete